MYSWETASCRPFPKYALALRIENSHLNIVKNIIVECFQWWSWHDADRENVIGETSHGLSLLTKVISLATLYSNLISVQSR